MRSSGDESSLPLSVQPKRLALLVYLALDDATGFRRRDSAVAYFWPELDTPLRLKLLDTHTFTSGVVLRSYVPADR